MRKYFILAMLLFVVISCATPDKMAKRPNLSKNQIEQILIKWLVFNARQDNGTLSDSTFNAMAVLSAIEDSLHRLGKLNKNDQLSYLQFSQALKDSNNRKIFLDIFSYYDPYRKLDNPLICSVIPGNLYEVYVPQAKKYRSLTLLWDVLKSYILDGSMSEIKDYEPYLKNISNKDFRKPIYRFSLLINNFYLCYYHGSTL